jgi:hypothetical protein
LQALEDDRKLNSNYIITWHSGIGVSYVFPFETKSNDPSFETKIDSSALPCPEIFRPSYLANTSAASTSRVGTQYAPHILLLSSTDKCLRLKITLDNEVLYLPAARITTLPCSVIYALNCSFWDLKEDQYRCQKSSFAKVFQYLAGLGLSNPDCDPQVELKDVLLGYSFGRNMGWPETSEAACTWIYEH